MFIGKEDDRTGRPSNNTLFQHSLNSNNYNLLNTFEPNFPVCSIDLLSEDMLCSTSDDGANPDLASLSPSPIMSSTPSPSYPTSYKGIVKDSQHKRLFNRNHDLRERMYGSDNGINIPNMKTGIKHISSNKTQLITIHEIFNQSNSKN